MVNYTQRWPDCERCGATFSWVFVEHIDDAEIYECEHCNNLKMFRHDAE